MKITKRVASKMQGYWWYACALLSAVLHADKILPFMFLTWGQAWMIAAEFAKE